MITGNPVAIEPAGDDPLAALRSVEDKLPDDLRAHILGLGAAAVPDLLAILADEDLGWPPVHAVDLLVELNATDAIEPLVAALAGTDWDDTLHDRIVDRLHELGAAVLEPALAELSRNGNPDLHESICAVLSKIGVRDERIYRELCKLFEKDETSGAMCFADYGDPRALPFLEQALRKFEPDGHGRFGLMGLADLVEAYNRLGGTLPDEILARVERVRTEWAERFRERFIRAEPVTEPVTSTKIGRNDPCPCGSGKKHKKCCLGSVKT